VVPKNADYQSFKSAGLHTTLTFHDQTYGLSIEFTVTLTHNIPTSEPLLEGLPLAERS